MRALLLIFVILSFSNCSRDVYRYNNTKYKWYNLEDALKKKNKVFALDLSESYLKKIPEKVATLNNLKFLNLRGNDIQELSKFIYEKDNLKVLYLDHNRKIQIDSNFAKLQSLEILDISFCGLKEFPEEIYKLKNLKMVAIFGNSFSLDQIRTIMTKMGDCRVIIG